MRKIVTLTLAGVCIFLGLLTVWTPLPTGVPLLAIGLFLLVAVSRRAKRALRWIRTHYPSIDLGIEWVEARAHRSMATTLKRTRPFRPKSKLGALAPVALPTGEEPPVSG